MEVFKKVISVVLIAVVAFGCGLAGGLLADKLKSGSGLSPGEIKEGADGLELSDLKNASYVTEDGKLVYRFDDKGNMVISITGDYSLAEIIAEKVMPSVVSVTTTYESSYNSGSIYDFFWGGGNGRPYTQEASCVGTGFIVDSNGYIVTNSHVVNDGNYKEIRISLFDGSEIPGTVLWSDATLDLAVVKVEQTGLVAAELGDSDLMKIGSYAAAIGNPLGLTFERSMSQGIISGLNRTITVASSSYGEGTVMEGLLQTDAAINSGNSGGPLLNSKGEVIGIASAKASDGESMGFAIPINVAKPIIEQIKATGSFERVYLGITAIGIEQQSSVSEEALIQYYGSATGIYVASVTKGGGAEEAGLQKGDVILKVNGTPVGTMNKMYSILVAFKSGEQVEVTYLRDGGEHTAMVTLLTSAELSAIEQ